MYKKFIFLSFCLLSIPGGILWAGVINPNITQIVFTTSPQTFDLGATSTVLTVQTQNASGTSEEVGATTKLNLASTGGGEFSSSDTNWIPVSQLTMNSSWANRNFYYRPSTSGSHTLTITAEGQSWTPATQIITINPILVPDTVPPVITLLGEAIVNLEAGDPYTDAGATALDDVDGDISGKITTTGLPLDTSATGTKQITYDVSDLAGNPAIQISRTVNVTATSSPEEEEEGPEEGQQEAPVITPTTISSGGGTGYVLGWKPIVTGQVLGTSTEKISKIKIRPKLTAEQRKLRALKRRVNHLAIKLYDLKHSQDQGDKVLGVKAETAPVVGITAPVATGTEATLTIPNSPVKKTFWKFW